MASYKRFKLPSLKVTNHSLCETKELHRNQSHSLIIDEAATVNKENDTTVEESSSTNAADDMLGFADHTQDSSMIEPTVYELQQRATVAAWEQLPGKMLSIAVENCALPVGQNCLTCINPAKFRCERCGPLVFYCFDCFCNQHETTNFFHVAEEWEVGRPWVCLTVC